MSDQLVLVKYENVQRIDLSMPDGSCRATVFMGANKQLSKAAVFHRSRVQPCFPSNRWRSSGRSQIQALSSITGGSVVFQLRLPCQSSDPA